MKITPRKARWLGFLGSKALALLGRTWRIRQDGPGGLRDDGIVAIWHGSMLPMAWHFRFSGSTVLISQHGDGELIARVVHGLGYETVRGSSTRGARRAVLELRKKHGGKIWAVTPDGPRGPARTVKEGLIRLAVETDRPIITLGVAAGPARNLSSWDRFLIPLPFARVQFWVDTPLYLPRGAGPERWPALIEQVRMRLESANKEAVRALDIW